MENDRIAPEEWNIITAALRRTATGYASMVASNPILGVDGVITTIDRCQDLAERFEKQRGLFGAGLTEEEYRFVVVVMETTAGVADSYAARLSAELKRTESDQQSVFAKACREVAQHCRRLGHGGMMQNMLTGSIH